MISNPITYAFAFIDHIYSDSIDGHQNSDIFVRYQTS